jgi:hypothetical protein
MENNSNLITESELMEKIPVTARKLHRLRVQKRIPFVTIDRYTRVYDLTKVLEALGTK